MYIIAIVRILLLYTTDAQTTVFYISFLLLFQLLIHLVLYNNLKEKSHINPKIAQLNELNWSVRLKRIQLPREYNKNKGWSGLLCEFIIEKKELWLASLVQLFHSAGMVIICVKLMI